MHLNPREDAQSRPRPSADAPGGLRNAMLNPDPYSAARALCIRRLEASRYRARTYRRLLRRQANARNDMHDTHQRCRGNSESMPRSPEEQRGKGPTGRRAGSPSLRCGGERCIVLT
jgi:hypothetical protein